MNILAILEGIISSVPQAIELYHKVVPHLSQNADISPELTAEIEAAAAIAHGVVLQAHSAIDQLISTHVSTAHADTPQVETAPAPTTT